MTQRLHELLAAWAETKPTIAALHLFGSRARGDFRPNSDVDLAFEFVGVDEDLAELISNAAKWKGELRAITGLEVKTSTCGRILKYLALCSPCSAAKAAP
jgi:predicted nucleotidyltransferase